MRRSKVGRASKAQKPEDPDKPLRPRNREKNKKEDEKTSILTAGGLIFMALCLSALSSGLQTAKDLTTQSETAKDEENGNDNSKTTIDPKKGQANNSGAEKKSNATTTPKATPPAPNNTSPSLIQRFFAIWANSTPTKEDNTNITEVTKEEDAKKSIEVNTPTTTSPVKKNLWQRKGNFTPIPLTPDPGFEKPEISPKLAKKIEDNKTFQEKALERDLKSHMLEFADQNKRQNSDLRSAELPPAPRNPDNKPSKKLIFKPRDLEPGRIITDLTREGFLREPMGGGTLYGHVPPKGSRGR